MSSGKGDTVAPENKSKSLFSSAMGNADRPVDDLEIVELLLLITVSG